LNAAAPDSPPSPAPPRLRDLKAAAQLLKPLLLVGRAGVTPAFIAALDEALRTRELVKIRFSEHKTKKKTLAPALAEATHSRLVMQVGHVAVFYRPRPPAPASAAPPA
jgi:RNA-binding protein